MSFRRAAAVIHAAGFSGRPCAVQSIRAAAKASCNASSARSKDCDTRIRLARMRPLSRRKIDSIVAFGPLIRSAGLSHLPQRSNLYVSRSALAGRGNLGCPFNCLIEVAAIEDVVTSQLFLG